MRFDDDVAAVVRSNSFQLINPADGKVAADLGILAELGPNSPAMRLAHQDSSTLDSYLGWSTFSGFHSEQVSLWGPTGTAEGIGSGPRLDLSSNQGAVPPIYRAKLNARASSLNAATLILAETDGSPSTADLWGDNISLNPQLFLKLNGRAGFLPINAGRGAVGSYGVLAGTSTVAYFDLQAANTVAGDIVLCVWAGNMNNPGGSHRGFIVVQDVTAGGGFGAISNQVDYDAAVSEIMPISCVGAYTVPTTGHLYRFAYQASVTINSTIYDPSLLFLQLGAR